MAVSTIPRYRRFAVRQRVHVGAAGGARVRALMIEISLEACRISADSHHGLRVDQVVTLEIDGFGDFRGIVRHAGEQSLAIRFVQPIASAELQELVLSAGDASRPILHLPAFGSIP